MIVNAGYRGKVGAGAPKFTYTGNYNERDDGVIELLTSGTITFLSPTVIDIFCVGGGGAGGNCAYTSSAYSNPIAGGGGAGGHTATVRKQKVSNSYGVIVGAGAVATNDVTPLAGGASSFGSLVTARGGNSVPYNNQANTVTGGANGGSGGGSGRISVSSVECTGGSDGGNGLPATSGSSGSYLAGGTGQGTTTKEFGEITGKLYAGGGGGGSYIYSNQADYCIGGAGGGGAGGWKGYSERLVQNAGAGSANTGGGGGGGAQYESYRAEAGSGGSGIVCFRVAK